MGTRALALTAAVSPRCGLTPAHKVAKSGMQCQRAGGEHPAWGLAKSPSGINGFDQIAQGGLPSGRTSLVCGGAGCGKTLFAIEFLVKGALLHDEPGVFVAFEETEEELIHNVASLGIRLDDLIARKLIAFDFIRVERSEIEEAGEYDLEGLFVRLAHAVSSIKARRIAIDSLEALFATFANEALLRAELRRLFRWLKDQQLTAVITGEKGDGALTRHGLEEYVSDCVIALDHRVVDQSSTRRMRIVKYRGSAHGTDEYPFLIDEKGFSVLPVTSLDLDYEVSTERISTGVAALDGMLEGGGYFRGSSVMVSGSAGTGKTSLAALFAAASCKRRERTLYFALEESASQIQRNVASIGLDLAELRRRKLLDLRTARPTVYGLEMHLVAMHNAIEESEPRAVIIDPISSLSTTGTPREVKSMLVRLFDYLKNKQIAEETLEAICTAAASAHPAPVPAAAPRSRSACRRCASSLPAMRRERSSRHCPPRAGGSSSSMTTATPPTCSRRRSPRPGSARARRTTVRRRSLRPASSPPTSRCSTSACPSWTATSSRAACARPSAGRRCGWSR